MDSDLNSEDLFETLEEIRQEESYKDKPVIIYIRDLRKYCVLTDIDWSPNSVLLFANVKDNIEI